MDIKDNGMYQGLCVILVCPTVNIVLTDSLWPLHLHALSCIKIGRNHRFRKSTDPSSGFGQLKLDDGEEKFRIPYPSHTTDVAMKPQPHSSSRDFYSPIPADATQQQYQDPSSLPWYPHREGISQHHVTGEYLPSDAQNCYATHSSPYSGYHHVPGSRSASVVTRQDPVRTLTITSRGDSPSFSSSSSPTPSSSRRRSGSSWAVVGFQDIGIAEAERILRNTHNLPSGVPLTLRSLADPPPGMKPHQSYNTLAQIAIWQSPRKRLTLQEIYVAIAQRFAFYRDHPDPKKWKSSIRHMLSNRHVFVPIRDRDQMNRGGYWELDFNDMEGSRRGQRRRRKRMSEAVKSDRDEDADADADVSGEEEMQQEESGYFTPAPSITQSQASPSATTVSGSSDRTFRAQPITSRRGMERSMSDLNSPALSGEMSGPVLLYDPTGGSPPYSYENPPRNQHDYPVWTENSNSSMSYQESAFYSSLPPGLTLPRGCTALPPPPSPFAVPPSSMNSLALANPRSYYSSASADQSRGHSSQTAYSSFSVHTGAPQQYETALNGSEDSR
ncbi:hypothetical protein E1B28_007925 [Marasmius oreades]|uniref:Fork-head domain-containing protein n=1 Tax=Marasmius oreades TaxID=181124 RepID=A0A9P7S419_9AGAR|nr:uncharacterized protein E1B28_007925 [Marasmius oreades]KAG7094326.1 hypothetical protein E1B28_007925 [Marasmius oreades]